MNGFVSASKLFVHNFQFPEDRKNNFKYHKKIDAVPNTPMRVLLEVPLKNETHAQKPLYIV